MTASQWRRNIPCQESIEKLTGLAIQPFFYAGSILLYQVENSINVLVAIKDVVEPVEGSYSLIHSNSFSLELEFWSTLPNCYHSVASV